MYESYGLLLMHGPPAVQVSYAKFRVTALRLGLT